MIGYTHHQPVANSLKLVAATVWLPANGFWLSAAATTGAA